MKKINTIARWLTLVVGAVVSLYVGGWLMFIQPILEACEHFDAGTLTGAIIGTTVLKCIFAGTAGGIVYYVCIAIYALIAALIKETVEVFKVTKGNKK